MLASDISLNKFGFVLFYLGLVGFNGLTNHLDNIVTLKIKVQLASFHLLNVQDVVYQAHQTITVAMGNINGVAEHRNSLTVVIPFDLGT